MMFFKHKENYLTRKVREGEKNEEQYESKIVNMWINVNKHLM